jgi:hypothetical protein
VIKPRVKVTKEPFGFQRHSHCLGFSACHHDKARLSYMIFLLLLICNLLIIKIGSKRYFQIISRTCAFPLADVSMITNTSLGQNPESESSSVCMCRSPSISAFHRFIMDGIGTHGGRTKDRWIVQKYSRPRISGHHVVS